MEVPKIYPRSSEINFKAIRSFDWEGDVLSVTDGIVNAFRDATDLQIIGHYQVDCTELREFLEAKRAGKELRPVVRGKWSIHEIYKHEMSYGVTGYEPVYKCSVCGSLMESYLRFDEPIMPEDASFPRFCPNCGADMRPTSMSGAKEES